VLAWEFLAWVKKAEAGYQHTLRFGPAKPSVGISRQNLVSHFAAKPGVGISRQNRVSVLVAKLDVG
jgi:hypothetical protein